MCLQPSQSLTQHSPESTVLSLHFPSYLCNIMLMKQITCLLWLQTGANITEHHFQTMAVTLVDCCWSQVKHRIEDEAELNGSPGVYTSRKFSSAPNTQYHLYVYFDRVTWCAACILQSIAPHSGFLKDMFFCCRFKNCYHKEHFLKIHKLYNVFLVEWKTLLHHVEKLFFMNNGIHYNNE